MVLGCTLEVVPIFGGAPFKEPFGGYMAVPGYYVGARLGCFRRGMTLGVRPRSV